MPTCLIYTQTLKQTILYYEDPSNKVSPVALGAAPTISTITVASKLCACEITHF